MRASTWAATALLAGAGLASCGPPTDARSPADCLKVLQGGLRPIADERSTRFLGKVEEATAGCRGGERAVRYRATPWVDWSNYWGTGDARSRGRRGTSEDRRGIEGALVDLEYQRLELIAFNLLDNGGTYEAYVQGRGSLPGPALEAWPELHLEQRCRGALVRYRTLTGICNDLANPAMGATGQRFSRLVEFEATFPELGADELAKNRHGDRIGLLEPDPQRISRALLSREGQDDYQKADTLNVLAAFWIQFQTHDWFSHLEEGRNGPGLMPTGCQAKSTDCRPDDRIDRSLFADLSAPPRFTAGGRSRLVRAYKTSRNTVTAWWDASQLYGYDETSLGRVKRDPRDAAKLLLVPADDDSRGYLPILGARDPMNPAWAGQEATAFPDNWSVGLSFFHNLFAREHNAFVDAFRAQSERSPEADCGLRDPDRLGAVVRYRDVTAEQLFEVAHLVVAAEIAKIHTLEWTTQLLYDEPRDLEQLIGCDVLVANHPVGLRRVAQAAVGFR